MARGGSRPGAGRPRLTDEEKAARAVARKASAKAKPAAKKKATARKAARKPANPAGHAPAGVKAEGAPEQWPFGTQEPQPAPAEPPKVEEDGEPTISADSPLALLLEVIKESRLKLSVRMQAAAIAAPFVHAKPAPVGKKVQKAADAAQVGSGKFKAAAPPRLVASR